MNRLQAIEAPKVVRDFIFRAWMGWAVLILASVWVRVSGLTAPCIKTAYYYQIWWVLVFGAIIAGLYTIWEMKRTEGTEAYEDIGMGKFVLACLLLGLWSALCCPIATG